MTSTARSCQRRDAARRVRPALVLLVLGLVALAPAHARRDDRDKPAEIVARSFDGSQQEHGYITYRGQVRITQGTLKATGDSAKAFLDGDNNVTRVLLTGTPAHIQQLDDHDNLMQGSAARIDYDNVKGVAVLTGQASISQQGRGEAHGDRLTYNTTTSQMSGESHGDGLVHMIFQPTHRPGQATPAAAGSAPAPGANPPAATSSTPAPAPATSAEQP